MDRTREYGWSDPVALAGAGEGRTGLEFLQAMASGELPGPPIADTMGFTLAEVQHGRAVFTAETGEYLYNPIGMVHGGFAATLLDSAAGCAVHSTLSPGVGYTSLDINLKFLRPIKSDSGPLRAIGTVITKGRRTALAQSELRDAADRLLAHATSTCMIFAD
ncbi:MAG TPA: PaaI family thioesterase [Pseudonocardiaceae bacterium]|jgi:uncharacterized protein (TIGR00369 family)|nr:PaaI family thioesterase [Pseudonocardiaceae bacterium]